MNYLRFNQNLKKLITIYQYIIMAIILIGKWKCMKLFYVIGNEMK